MPKASEPNKIIYSMIGVGKVHGTKQVLKDISLSYFYGAKIGVLGLNGAGKSTLLREGMCDGMASTPLAYFNGMQTRPPGSTRTYEIPPKCSLDFD